MLIVATILGYVALDWRGANLASRIEEKQHVSVSVFWSDNENLVK